MGKENLIVFPLTLHLVVQKGAKSITSGNLICLLTFRRLNPALNKVEENAIMLKHSTLKARLVTKCFRLMFQLYSIGLTLHKIGKKQLLFPSMLKVSQHYLLVPTYCTGAQIKTALQLTLMVT